MVHTVNFSVPSLSVWQFYVTDHFQGKESKLNIPVVRSWQSPDQMGQWHWVSYEPTGAHITLEEVWYVNTLSDIFKEIADLVFHREKWMLEYFY
jgi:hypothetical protein